MIGDIANRRQTDVVPLIQDAKEISSDSPKPIRPARVTGISVFSLSYEG